METMTAEPMDAQRKEFSEAFEQRIKPAFDVIKPHELARIKHYCWLAWCEAKREK